MNDDSNSVLALVTELNSQLKNAHPPGTKRWIFPCKVKRFISQLVNKTV